MIGKVYIVTGATGLAAETIHMLLERGSYVYFAGRTVIVCEDLLSEINDRGYDADYVVGDITNEAVVVELVRSCIKVHGRIDGLFNVTAFDGVKYNDGPLHACLTSDWQTTMDINLKTQFMMCKHVLQYMLMQEPDDQDIRGIILNMCSMPAFSPGTKENTAIAYAAGKGAIISMTKTAAEYYAKHKIRINAITPEFSFSKKGARISENVAIVDFVQEESVFGNAMLSDNKVANAAIFLLGDQSQVMTGETMMVDVGSMTEASPCQL